MPASHVRALLIPKRKLSRKLGVLIYARFDLQWPIDQTRFGEVVNQKRAVSVAVAASRHPADHVVTIRGRERKNLDKLSSGFFVRQLHQHKVRLERLLLLLILFIESHLARDTPQVFALKERIDILSMIKAKHLALRLDKSLRIAHMSTKVGGHFRGVMKKRGKGRAIGLNQRIFRIKNVEAGTAVVSIDDNLHAVANIVYGLVAGLIVTRVRIFGGFGERSD